MCLIVLTYVSQLEVGYVLMPIEVRSCVDTDTGSSLVEQYTTVDKYLRAGHFDSLVSS